MSRIYIKDLHDHVGKEVTVAGWVDVRRDQGKLIFIELRDISGKAQMVSFAGNKDVHAVVGTLRPEWVIEVHGVLNKRPEKTINPEFPLGDIEIEVKGVEVLGRAQELPFEKDAELNLDTYLDHLPLTLRTARARAIFTVQTRIITAYRMFLSGKGFTEFQAPKLVGGDAEGGAAVFRVEYFHNKDAYLATSPQLYKQIMAGVFERIFVTGNVFRGEKHSTTRHLNEYTSLDAEMAFIVDHHSVMEMLAQTARYITVHLKENSVSEFTLLGAEFPIIPETIPTMKLREAQKLIYEKTKEDCREEKDLTPEHERWLSEYARNEFGSDYIFITHFPIQKTAFYAYEDPEDPGYAKYFDLLFRGVEIASGGQRVHDYDMLVKRIEAKGLDPQKFSFYLQAFKYGMPPHGGWGMGLERLTQKFLGLSNVKEATLFPRDINRIDTLLSE